MLCNLDHPSLATRLSGLRVNSTDQYRGIPYGNVRERFQPPQHITKYPASLTCTNYGPRCPQNEVDVRYLLRIPEHIQLPQEAEDEFQCLNLDVVMPSQPPLPQIPLPILIWIHGGSQVVTFASPASGICNPERIVQDAAKMGQPLIFVSISYRLNIFAFGDGDGPVNLALLDQRLAIDWVRQHIAGFGGDPNNITLAGESAGAVYCHAHLVMDAPVQRVVLSSGSLYLSPPQPLDRGTRFITSLKDALGLQSGTSLKNVPAKDLLYGLERLEMQTMWLQMTPDLEDWPNKLGLARSLLIGDVEYESVIWADGIRSADIEQLDKALTSDNLPLQALKDLYCISPERKVPTQTGALDLVNDVLFALPVEILQQQYNSFGRPAYRYLVDQGNPYQASHGAHHALDLLLLFGGLDLSFDLAAEKIGQAMRAKWIDFATGKAPWSDQAAYAFGPYGNSGELTGTELDTRRRRRHLNLLKTFPHMNLLAIVRQLVVGRINLLN